MNRRRQKDYNSIVQKIAFRSLTGQGLGLAVHTHLKLLFHLSWNPGFRKGSYENCVARHTAQSALWYQIVNQIRSGGLVGLCKCVFATIVGYDDKTITDVCFHTAHSELNFFCRCRVEFSLEVGEKFKYSLFLEDGRMVLFKVADGTSGEC
jgi:hypothetical protein